MRRVLSSVVYVVAVVTAVVSLGTVVQAKPSDCCGVGDPSSCGLQHPYRGCTTNENCTNPDYPTCCPSGGFCSL